MSILSYIQCLWQDLAYGQSTLSWMNAWIDARPEFRERSWGWNDLPGSSYIDPLAESTQLNGAAQAESEEAGGKEVQGKIFLEDADRCRRSLYQGC